MDKPLLIINNKHVSSSGTPPFVTNDDPNNYYGYYENVHGEQLLFIADRKSRKAQLWGGDFGWGEGYNVLNGSVPSLVLDEQEKIWVQCCWSSAFFPR